MDLKSEKIIKLMFPGGVPENLRDNPELFNYLNKLGSYKVDQLKREQTRLAEETKTIVEETQDLAISNYKTFIKTAENSRSIYSEFQNAESQVEILIDKLSKLIEKCENFQQESAEINKKRHSNSITLKKSAQLLEILELPQLMERCIRKGRYEEALELASYVQKMGENHGNIPIIKSIVHSVELLWHTMLVQLVSQLRTDLQLPQCLQIVGYLRRMQAFDTNELKLKFLQARDAWLTNLLKTIPIDDAQQHLTKTIEVTRVNLFNIINQYKAIFPEEDLLSSEALPNTMTSQKPLQSVSSDGSHLFQSWLHEKVCDFLNTLEFDLQRDVVLYDTVLGQCMYFGLSFSRVGADFRALMVPIFVKVIKKKFKEAIATVNQNFEKELEKYTLINKVTVQYRNILRSDENDVESFSPPEILLDFHPLATLCNGYLNVLNDLRLCAPTALANYVTSTLQQSLEIAAKRILAFYRQEQQAFTTNERDIFTKMCTCFAYDLIAYLQRCIHAIFPPNVLSSQLGLSLNALENTKITYLQKNNILEPLKDLFPKQVDKYMKFESPKAMETNSTAATVG